MQIFICIKKKLSKIYNNATFTKETEHKVQRRKTVDKEHI